MVTPSTNRPHVDLDRDRVLDDELPVESEEHELPERLDRELEVPEADAVESALEVPVDDDER
jgi:hypothetical protein